MAAFNQFGHAVAISGDTVVVGSAIYTATALGAHIFVRNEGGEDAWGHVTEIISPVDPDDVSFGATVAISGDTVFLSGNSDVAPGLGAVYIFERNQGGSDNWGYVTVTTGSDTLVGDGFGSALAIDGDTLLVGANLDSHFLAGDAGSAYFFKRNYGGPDNWGQVRKIKAIDGAESDFFGEYVALSDDIAVVGAWADDHSGFVNAGSAYVFERNNGGTNMWGQVTKLMAGAPAAEDQFGISVSVCGETAVVGANRDDHSGMDNAGNAYIFGRNNGGPGQWGQVTMLMPSDAAEYDRFGGAVAISGDVVVVGSSRDDHSGFSDPGSGYVFMRDAGGPNGWSQVTKLIASDAASTNYLGGAAAFSGDTVVFGAEGHTHSGLSWAGAAYVFRPASFSIFANGFENGTTSAWSTTVH